ncbi:MAG: GGDEF domain-containing protein [Sandaracinaceae bacterium]
MSSHDAYDPDLPEPTRIRGKERVTANLYELIRRGEPRAPAPRAPKNRATLLFIEGPSAGSVLALGPGESVTLGRGLVAQHRIPEDTLSREHARIFWDASLPEGPGYAIEDLGSTQGTWVDRRRVRRPYPLSAGQRVHLGPHVSFRFDLHDAHEQRIVAGLHDAAMRDALTGAYTRRYFHERLRSELSYARRHDVPVALIMLDLDHFKNVNDSYGHVAGDTVLRVVAAQLKTLLRPEDVLIRYGGEELCVLLRGLDLSNAYLLAERLRRAVKGLRVPYEEGVIRVTVSAGVAAAQDPDEPPQMLVERADEALYLAKERGRDCVCLHDGDDARQSA